MSNFSKAIASLSNSLELEMAAAVEAGQKTYQEKLIAAYGQYQLAKSVVIQGSSVVVAKDYAYYLEYGNNQEGPFIYPKNGKFLKFEIGGKTVFARKVRSYAGKHIAERTLDESIPAIEQAISSRFGRKF